MPKFITSDSPRPSSEQLASLDITQPTKIVMKNALVGIRLLTTK
ncbi:MAG: hypothetical protein VXZ91_02055 [Pseudomonadota bacterium]|nr:hypothetical protein [Pseudomonadota bacterium]